MPAMFPENPHILMIAPACMPPVSAEAIVNAKLALAMHEADWQVDVISMSNQRTLYTSDDYSCWDPLARLIHDIPMRSSWRLSDVLSRLRAATRIGYLTTSLVWADHALGYITELARKRRFDYVIGRASPVISHAVALTVAHRLGVPMIANWNDPVPGACYPPPYGAGPEGTIEASDARMLRHAARDAAWHTFPSERLRRYMCGYIDPSGRMLTRSSVIPHLAAERFRQSSPAPTNGGTFVLCHAGELHPPRDGGVLLKAIQLFLERRTDRPRLCVRLLGREQEGLSRQASDLGLSGVVEYCGSQPYPTALAELARAHVAVIVEAACPDGVFLPSKFVDYIQVGRPILALSPANGTLADILTQFGGGIAADVTDPAKVADAIEKLYEHWREDTLQRAFGSAPLYDHFGEHRVLDYYREMFGQLRSRSGQSVH